MRRRRRGREREQRCVNACACRAKAQALQYLGRAPRGDAYDHGDGSVDEAAWWYLSMERSCQAQLLAEAAGEPHFISSESAKLTNQQVGSTLAGWFQFQPLYARIVKEQPDLLE